MACTAASSGVSGLGPEGYANIAPRPNAARLMISQLNRYKREQVDLHNGEFCVDVSTYGDITFTAESREQCDTEFVKRCEQKSEQVRYF